MPASDFLDSLCGLAMPMLTIEGVQSEFPHIDFFIVADKHTSQIDTNKACQTNTAPSIDTAQRSANYILTTSFMQTIALRMALLSVHRRPIVVWSVCHRHKLVSSCLDGIVFSTQPLKGFGATALCQKQ